MTVMYFLALAVLTHDGGRNVLLGIPPSLIRGALQNTPIQSTKEAQHKKICAPVVPVSEPYTDKQFNPANIGQKTSIH